MSGVNRLNIGSSVIVALDEDTMAVTVRITNSVEETRAEAEKRLGSLVLVFSGVDRGTADVIHGELNDMQLPGVKRKDAYEHIRAQVRQVVLERRHGVQEE